MIRRANLRVEDMEAEIDRTKIVMGLLKNVPADQALDVGCGSGFTTRALIEKGWKVIGIDVFPTHNFSEIVGMDLNNGTLPFPDGFFGLVVCTETLEHTFVAERILKELKRVLKNDGFAVISLPNAFTIYNRRDVLFGKSIDNHSRYDQFSHHYFCRIEDNTNFIQKEFKILETKHQWITKGKAGFIAKLWRDPRLFSISSIYLCQKK